MKTVLKGILGVLVAVLSTITVFWVTTEYTDRTGAQFKHYLSASVQTAPKIPGEETEVLVRGSSCRDFVLYNAASGEVLLEGEESDAVPMDSQCTRYFYAEAIHKGKADMRLIAGGTILLEVVSLDGSSFDYTIPINNIWLTIGFIIAIFLGIIVAIKL